jgi:2-dehydro-3-deoxy-D-arabinonate dehydratase
MKLYKTKTGIVVEDGAAFYAVGSADWDTFVNDDDLAGTLRGIIAAGAAVAQAPSVSDILPPLQSQEIWACGVTYMRSKVGRQEESKSTGGAEFYARVYEADRPEIFFKATAYRTVGTGGTVRIRKDSTWDVPEPELTLSVTSSGKIVAYTIGNDMSSRSIEGENPLYLPQAKTFDACAAVGPCLYVTDTPLPPDTLIQLEILRAGSAVFTGEVSIDQIKRKLPDLVSWLFRECTFPHGCLVMTGTGIVPPNDFTLRTGDEIRITIAPIGTLVNVVG